MKTKKEYINTEAWMIREYHKLFNEYHKYPQHIRATSDGRHIYGERLASTNLVFFIL